ncbi:MAG: class I SAM-dependent methyltransferase [Chloroflexota bacterium]|nr:MAG: class I SAM-dependent methyltransferase [Chloroflexota bacterium]
MLDLQETYRVEQDKWNDIARQQLARLQPSRYRDFYHYAQDQITMTGIAEFLGDLRGLKVLEVGCGLGKLTTLLAKSGAKVTAFDLSEMSTYVARERAKLDGVVEQTTFCTAAGEQLPFADETFDVIFGKGVLHHLKAGPSRPELFRVLKRGGKAAFSEPLGMNPLLRIARDYLPYRQKNPRGADKPLTYADIRDWSQGFAYVSVREVQLLSMLERALGRNNRFTLLRKIDDVLLRQVPPLRRFCRYAVLLFEKK